MRIRIIGFNGSDKHSGVFGADGEIAPGSEFDIKGEPPAAWAGKYEVVSRDAVEDSEFLTGNDEDDDDERFSAFRVELLGKAQEHIDGLKVEHGKALDAANARAASAESALAAVIKERDELAAKFAGAASKIEAATVADITSAIGLLDKSKDDHWTAAGLPAVDAVTEIAGKPVTRKAIEEAAPEAKRPL